MADYKAVLIEKGPGGWGGPLTILPTDEKPLIYCVTGGGIHPIAARIAELTGGEVFDGFKSSAPFEKIAVAVIDCGGTARIGVTQKPTALAAGELPSTLHYTCM